MIEEFSNHKLKPTTETLIEGRQTVKKRKVLVLGAPGVGKSAIIMRFKDDIFLDYYDPTIQMSYKKTLRFNNENIELELIDIDGQTEYTIFSYSKFSMGIHGYILSYSIENRQSFELLKIIHSKLVGLAGREIPKILVANKCDLFNKREISIEEGKALAKSINCPFIEVSAKSSDNINKMFHTMLVEIKKYENNVDFKGLTCRRLFEFFIRNENGLIKIFYTLMIVFMVRKYINSYRPSVD
jgi:Ras family protein